MKLLTTEEEAAQNYQRLVNQRIGSELQIEVCFVADGVISSVEAKPVVGLPVVSDVVQQKSDSLASSPNLELVPQSATKLGAYMSVTSAGLEVARVLEFEEEAVVEVGVGQADREIHALTSQGTAEEILVSVADRVHAIRYTNRDKYHPLAKLDPAGFLRFRAYRDPQLLGLGELDLLPNIQSDDVFTESPRAAVANDSLLMFSLGANPSLYELAGDYLQLLKDSGLTKLVVVSNENDAAYIKPEGFDGLDVELQIKTLQALS